MANMSYCAFQNTAPDLEDCVDRITDELSPCEHWARVRIINMAADILDALNVTYDSNALQGAIEGLVSD